MDISGNNHLPPELHPHDHESDVRPRWLPLALGILVILVAALALMNRERFLASTPDAAETEPTSPEVALNDSEGSPTDSEPPVAPPAPKPVVTAPKPKPVATAPVTTASAPTGLKLSAVAGPDGTNLTWTATSMNNFAGYKIVRSTDNPNLAYPPDGYIRYHTDRSNTAYLDTGAIAGRSYYYRVCAVSTDKKVSCGNIVETIGD